MLSKSVLNSIYFLTCIRIVLILLIFTLFNPVQSIKSNVTRRSSDWNFFPNPLNYIPGFNSSNSTTSDGIVNTTESIVVLDTTNQTLLISTTVFPDQITEDLVSKANVFNLENLNSNFDHLTNSVLDDSSNGSNQSVKLINVSTVPTTTVFTTYSTDFVTDVDDSSDTESSIATMADLDQESELLIENFTTPESFSTSKSPTLRSTRLQWYQTNPKITKTEFEEFREILIRMKGNRERYWLRLNNYFSRLGTVPEMKKLSDVKYRVYDFQTGIQFEDEFDCDLNLLADCESSLLLKIEIVEARYVVFTLNRTEEDEVSSQIDVLNICRSMDKEFSCLINFADKCQDKLTWSTFSILKYIITQNNETIVSCKKKAIDWLGPEPNQNKLDDDFVDEDGIHHHLSHEHGPCIQSKSVESCWIQNMGRELQFGKDAIQTVQQCEMAYHFERCLKTYLYEEASPCSLDEKEASLQIILGSVKWNLQKEYDQQHISHLCFELRHQWSNTEQHIIGSNDIPYKDKWDRAKRFAYDLRTDLGNALDPVCDLNVRKFDKPCQNRFERRIRDVWINEDMKQLKQIDLNLNETNVIKGTNDGGDDHGSQGKFNILFNGQVIDQEKSMEIETICCSISEFKKCISIYILLNCGKEKFKYFNNRILIDQLDQCLPFAYGSDICKQRLNN